MTNISDFRHRWKKLKIEDSALLVVDMQEYFLNEKSHAYIPDCKNIISNTKNLLDIFRRNNRPIVHTYFAVKDGENDPIINWWNDTVKDGSSESRIVKELSPKDDELIMRKPTYDAFYQTNLNNTLQSKNIKQIVIAGVLTNLCCETSAREAFVRGYDVFIATDCMTAYDRDMHEASIRNLAYGFATPLELKDL